MSVSYFKRFRMEFDLRGRRSIPVFVPHGYRLLAWQPDLLADHAEAKYLSFRNEIDADVFEVRVILQRARPPRHGRHDRQQHQS